MKIDICRNTGKSTHTHTTQWCTKKITEHCATGDEPIYYSVDAKGMDKQNVITFRLVREIGRRKIAVGSNVCGENVMIPCYARTTRVGDRDRGKTISS